MPNLTAVTVKNAKPGRHADGGGLYLLVKPTGTRSWLLRVQVDGRRRDIGVGSVADVTLAEARQESERLRKQARAGLDPVSERKRARARALTFRDAAKQVHEEHKRSWKNGKHSEQWLKTLELYAFPDLGDRSVSEIDGSEIRDVLAKIWLDIPETARRVRQRIGVVLDWCYAKGLRTAEAPMRSVSRGLPRQPGKTGHHAAMPYAEVPAFVRQLRGCLPTFGRMALELLIRTACRSGEVRGARWQEFDLQAAAWTIPAERMKTGRQHVVPLAAEATAVLQAAAEFRTPGTDLVFPGQNPKMPLSDMTLLKILRDLQLKATVHGFRSSFRDWAAEMTSFPGEIAEAALAHVVPNRVEAAYRRTDFLAKRRQLMADWNNFLA